MKRLILLILFCIGFFRANGQEVVVTASFDSSRIFIGDQIQFSIIIDQPSDISLDLPVFKDTLCKNIEILNGPVTDSATIRDGRLKITEKYLITSFDSGYYQLPPVYAELKSSQGIKRYYSDYTRLEVIRVNVTPADTTADFYDIIKPYRAPVTAGEILPWFLLAVLLGAVVWAAIRYLPRLKKSQTIQEELINPDPAHIIAFRELEKLRDQQLWQKGDLKHYYTRLTEILRLYLENRFRVYSLELTTDETLQSLLKTGFKKDRSYKDLESVLKGADLVKFAKYKPEPSENEIHFQISWGFVEATKENDMLYDEKTEKVEKEEDKV